MLEPAVIVMCYSLTCSKILSRYINDTVGIDVKCYLDLRNSTSCWRDSIQTELAEGFVVFCELTLTLYNVDIYSCLVVCRCGEDLVFFVGIVVFLSISLWHTPPMVSMERTGELHPEEGYLLHLHRLPAYRPG